MATNPSDPTTNTARASGLQSMLARLKGMVQSDESTEESQVDPESNAAPLDAPPAAPTLDNDLAPNSDQAAPADQATPAVPMATAVALAPDAVPVDIPIAQPVLPEVPPAPGAVTCPVCRSIQSLPRISCDDCGYYFSPADLANAAASPCALPVADIAPADSPMTTKLQGRYELREKISERCGVSRFRGVDLGDGSGPPVPVVILRQELPALATPVEVEASEPAGSADQEEEILPGFDDPMSATTPITAVLPPRPAWPGISWEHSILRTIEQPGLPRVVDQFSDDAFEYLVVEVPTGRPFWDAWDDPEVTNEKRFHWLIEVAEILHCLHQCNAMLEGVRPDIIVIADDGYARLTDMADLLPIPLPADAPIRGHLYTAPELMTGQADARADLYSFGALLYALHVGRDLSETDFDRPGHPKPFVPRFPDIHPAFGRLMAKTFRREIEARFPTEEATREDPTGFIELIRTLNVLGRTLDTVRLEIACWTTTGMVRTGNEDAFAILHACETRQDDLSDMALVLLCDGMGGYEAGEVAAALAIQEIRKNLVQQKPFAPLAGNSAFPNDALASATRPEGHAAAPLDPEVTKQLVKSALKEANKQVFAASRAPGSKRRGMGCTAEVVLVDGRHVVVGHVGDSRTYHLHEGRMIQMTRDQTLVNRLVELGTLSPEEAETHPRRNELQQAIGGQPDVEPGLYHGVLKPGDWVLVCSDGVTNHITANQLKQMLQTEAQSADMAARRLVNFANIEGATDNATIVVIRAV
jgi:serine/threonine protein phosphatase PrpC